MSWKFRSKGNKFNRTKTELDGHSFASKLEASVYTILKSRENAGEIRIDQVQDHIYLTDARILYVSDFRCKWVQSDEQFWVEAKGFETPEWRIKLRLWKFYGPGKLEIYKGTHLRPFLDETITPQNRGACL